MSAPGNLPLWATDETYSSGDDVGEATRLEPTTGEKEQGFHRGKRLPARKLNWLLGSMGDWIQYINASLGAVVLSNWEAQAPVGSITLEEVCWSPDLSLWV